MAARVPEDGFLEELKKRHISAECEEWV